MSEATRPMRYIGRLSAAMQDVTPQVTYCKCSDCRLLFLDDLCFRGTTYCPVCKHAALQRGLTLNQAADMLSTEEQRQGLRNN